MKRVALDTSIPIVKMGKLLEDQEVNAAYWYHSWWRDIGSRVKSFDKETNGDNRFPIGKHVEKMTRQRQGGFYLQEDLFT
jgi:hypothetical protein